MLVLREVYIVDGIRTPIGRFGRSLKDYSAVDLSSFTIKKLLERTGLEPTIIDFIVMGHVIRAGTGMNTARQAAIKAGIPLSTDAMNVDMVCASGMAAIIVGALHVSSGFYDIVIAGGMESMSNSPLILPSTYRWGVRHFILDRGKGQIYDSMVYDGLIDPLLGYIMGEEADITARRYEAPREVLDWIGYESHKRAAQAWNSGVMRRYVESFTQGSKIILDKDEGVRFDIKIEDVRAQTPVFTKEGPHTVATSSQLSDGAASLLLASGEAVKKLNLQPKARIIGYEYSAVDPVEFPVAPIVAVKKLLSKIGWSIDRVDFWENNEAFAVNNYLMNKLLEVPYDRLNVHGGAIAVGHPLGASGARIVIELINVLETRRGERGVASICHGLGGAAAIAIELT
ncbi:MAG: thiolase family protein [Acidilobaceae archaeon]